LVLVGPEQAFLCVVALADPDTIVTADETGETTLVVKGFETAVRVRTSRRV
jgi:hypothetical protein